MSNKAAKIMLRTIASVIFAIPSLTAGQSTAPGMKLTSPAFLNLQPIPPKYGCDGRDISPPLKIEGVPKEARSLALVVEDPDAPAGTWVHWLLWNMDPATTQIAEGTVPRGAEEGTNSWQRKSYGGPCPPSGTHRYIFRLYALKERLHIPSSSNRSDLERGMQGKILARAELSGRYRRK